MSRYVVFLSLFLPCYVVAAELEVREGYDRLTNGYDDWRSHVASFNHQFEPRKTLYGEAAAVDRFSLADQGLMLGFYWPLGREWTIQFEKKYSEQDQYNILPQSSHMIRMHHKLPQGWGAAIAQRKTLHNLASISGTTLEVENYHVRFYSLYKYTMWHVGGAGDTETHSLQMRYLFSGSYYLGFGAGFGREVEIIAVDDYLISGVRHLFINGLYMLNNKISLTAVVSKNVQGSLYQKEGLQVGLRYSF